ncbi:hypothetical protein KBI23_18180 [bacterium]|nr:hypothetical protein [bacterium]
MSNATAVTGKQFSLKSLTFGSNNLFDVIFIILGGLPLYLPFLCYLGEAGLRANVPFDWAFWGNQIVSMPHVWATYARLTRKIREGKVHFLFGAPAYLAVVTLLLIASINGFFLEAMTAVNVWQSFHYLRQVYGISRFFGRSDGEPVLEKSLSFWAFHLAMPLFVIGRWNMLYVYWHGKPSDAIIPVSFPQPLLMALWIIAGVGLCLGLYLELLKYKRAQQYDCSGLLILLVYFAIHWFGFLSIHYYFIGFITVTIFHAVQYLGIAWHFEEKQSTTNIFTAKALKALPTIVSFAAFWLVVYFVGDFAQNVLMPLGNSIYPKFALVCLSSVSAHHYLVDTFLWGRKAGI